MSDDNSDGFFAIVSYFLAWAGLGVAVFGAVKVVKWMWNF